MALFSMDSKFMKFMDRLVDVMALNLLWLLCCLPVITIGAATTAAFSVALKMVDDEDGSLFRAFFRAFRTNFRRGTLLWFIHAAALYALYLDVQLLTVSDDPSILLLVVSIVSVVLVFGAFLYAYPLLARYDSTVKQTLQNSLKICLQYPGRTTLLIVLLAFEVSLFLWNTTLMLVGALIGPFLLLFTISGIGKRVFQSIEKDKG